MYYDMQSDRLYDNEYAMEGILGNIKNKLQSKKEKKEAIQKERIEKEKQAIILARPELEKAVKIIEAYITKAKNNSRWKHLPFKINKYFHDESWEISVEFQIFADKFVMNSFSDNYDQEAIRCFEYILISSKNDIEKLKYKINVNIPERNFISLSIDLDEIYKEGE